MAMVINNNIAAMTILGETTKNNKALKKSLEKVSSGMKINSAGDGASEYSISKKCGPRYGASIRTARTLRMPKVC